MDAVEKAIRNALEKGDASDRAFREKVYRSAFAALERSVQAKPDLAAEEAERRRHSLKHGITQIESEFVPAVAEPDGPDAPTDEPRGERDDDEFDARAREDNVSDEAIDAVQADERARWTPARRPRLGASRIPLLAVVVLVLVVIAGAIWWAMVGGPTRRQAGDEKRNQEATVDNILRGQSGGDAPADGTGDGQAAIVPDDDWITVFSASDATAIGAPPGAEADIVQGEDASFVRITAPGANTALRFDVGQGALEALSGGGIVFSIVARAEDGGETEMSVSCDLGALGDCGRKRYGVNATRSEYLLEVETSDRPPGAGGTIAIVPDISGEGRALELFAIRASRASE